MKRFVWIATALVVMAMATTAQDSKVPDLPRSVPKLSDAFKISLVIAQRDFFAAQAHLTEVTGQCPNFESARKVATNRRDDYQKLIDTKPCGDGFVLNLDKVVCEAPKKP